MNFPIKIRRSDIARQRGFSLIEVLIALVVLAVGLLGLALLQTMNLRYTKSADQRTKAVNLAGGILDSIRSNRSELNFYTVTNADFDGATASGGCGSGNAMNAQANVTRWVCEVKEALGPNATGSVTIDGSQVTVVVSWDEGNMPSLTDSGRIELETML